jgi:hypothetical protein
MTQIVMSPAMSLADFASPAGAGAAQGGPAGIQMHRTWEAAASGASRAPRASARRAARREYRLVWGLAFVIFLAVALLGRLMPARTRIEAFGGRRSILGDARALTNSTIPIAFMA